MTELDVLVGTLRTEVQQSYNAYKAESILLKLAQDERLQEIAEKVSRLLWRFIRKLCKSSLIITTFENFMKKFIKIEN